MTKDIIKKFKISLINSICLLVILMFYLLDSLLKIIIPGWVFITSTFLSLIIIALHVFIEVKNKEKYKKVIKSLTEYLEIFLFAVIIVEITFTFIMFPATVQQTSMMPTFGPGDELVVRRTKDIKNNDVIVFSYDEDIQKPNIGIIDDELLIKRVIAIPGQSFYYENSKLYINGIEADDKFIVEQLNGLSLKTICEKNNKLEECTNDSNEYILKDGWYVVMGDNRGYNGSTPISIDSRSFGIVHESQIHGRVDYRMDNIFKWIKVGE